MVNTRERTLVGTGMNISGTGLIAEVILIKMGDRTSLFRREGLGDGSAINMIVCALSHKDNWAHFASERRGKFAV